MSQVLGNVALIFVFILIGGVFAAAEMALVSLRESQIRQLATRGKRGETIAQLTENPNRFLAAGQVGVTLAGFLSASFGGATLSSDVAPLFVRMGLSQGVADVAALVLITLIISYFSIVLSELAAKRLAMQRAETFALALAPMVNAIANFTRPVIWFLGKSTDVVVRLLGGDPNAGKEEVSEEELRNLVVTSPNLGREERQIVDEVFAAGDRSLREVMVPRTEVDFLPGDMTAARAIRQVKGAPHSRYPVTGGSTDQIIGFLHVRDLFDIQDSARSTPLRQLVRPVLSLPETVPVLRALTEMRRASSHLAIVRDEYGGTAGIVTLEDLVEELIGDITDEYDVTTPSVHLDLQDVDGLMTLEDFTDRTGLLVPEGPYDTIAGFLMAQLGHLPQIGDAAEVALEPRAGGADQVPIRIAVTELDGRRAAWLRVSRLDGESLSVPPTTSEPVEGREGASSGGKGHE